MDQNDAALFQHVTDAAIAAQLPPPLAAEFLVKVARLKAAREVTRKAAEQN